MWRAPFVVFVDFVKSFLLCELVVDLYQLSIVEHVIFCMRIR
jgi:hypothetical protein